MANENNIPNEINLPGPLTGRNDSSNIAPMGFAAFATNMKSDIAPMSTLSFTTRFKSDIPTIPFVNFTTAMKSDIASIAVSQFDPNLKSFIAPKLSVLGSNNESSNTAPSVSTLGANNIDSSTAPITSTLGANNIDSSTTPLLSTLGANNTDSNIAPITSTLTGRFDTSDIVPLVSQLQGRFDSSDTSPVTSTLTGRHESSAIDSSATTLSGRHESSAINDGATTLDGRHESSDIDSSLTTPDGRFESSDIDSSPTTLDGRHESSGIDDGLTTPAGRHESSGIDDGLTTPDGRFTNSSIDDSLTTPDGRHESSAIGDALTTQDGRHFPGPPPPQPTIDITSGVDFFGFNTDAPGFTIQNSLLDSQYQGISGGSYTYPDSQGLGFGILSTPIALAGRNESSNFSKEPGVNFVDIPNTNASGFTVQNSLLDSQFKGISGNTYTYPDAQGLGFGSVDSSLGVNFVDIPNLDSQGFTTFFDTGTPTQFKGATAGDYTYPDSHGLGYGLIGNSLFTNTYPTPYTTPIFPDGFVQNQPIEESQFSLESFAGGGKIGLGTEGFEHATFGGPQGQVPVMGNNPTGLGEFTSGGNTSGDIGIVNAFDDTTSGAKGFTPQMFDLGLPKTQFNGVAGTPGALTYAYPTEVGPAGTGRLMYDTPFSDAGNPYGGAYTSELAKQIPVNPSINRIGFTLSPVGYNLYDAAPDRLHFHEGNKYEQSLGEFATSLTLNGSHPKSILADFASREGSPTPLDAIKILIPGNTGPVGAENVTAQYTSMDGYPNYNTQNISYSSAGVLNQREGFERTELKDMEIWGDEGEYGKATTPQRGDGGFYFTSDLYGHNLAFGGTGDDPKGLKSYTTPHILRNIGLKWNGEDNESTPFDEGAFRGGFLTLGNRALLDVTRNTKHIIADPIKGLLWGLKQIGLQASNPKVETEAAPFLGLKRPTRIFNLGIGLLANMLTGPFGIKLYRHGLLNGLGSGKGLYEAAVKAHNAPDRYDTPGDYPNKGGGNRLIGLKEDLIIKTGGEAGVGGLLGGLLGQTGVEIKPLSDSAFFNGPKSLYGIGGTTIRRYSNSNVHPAEKGIEKVDETNAGGGDSGLLAKYAVLSYGQIQKAAEEHSSFHDFRQEAFENGIESWKFLSAKSMDEDLGYDNVNREVLFGYHSYNAERERQDFSDNRVGLVDPYNIEDFDADQDYTDEVDTDVNNTRDMIKLIIEDLQTEKKVRFRSYVTDISDTITPSWSPSQYVGRPDNVYSYTNTERSVSFTLKLAAMSRTGMKGMYKKANFLYGLAYPHFKDTGTGNNAIQAPYIRLTLGDYLYKCPGFFDSITISIDQESPWEINLENDPEVAQLPHMLTATLSFKVIGDGPHTSAVESDSGTDVRGIHIGGGLNTEQAAGKFFENLHIDK